MKSSKMLQSKYVNLYQALRNYIWNIDMIDAVADLETSVYAAFPNVDDIQRNIQKVESYARDILFDDEEMQACFAAFKEMIPDSSEDVYCKLAQVKEVIQ